MVRGMRALTSAWKALTATPAPRFARVARVAFDIDATADYRHVTRTRIKCLVTYYSAVKITKM